MTELKYYIKESNLIKEILNDDEYLFSTFEDKYNENNWNDLSDDELLLKEKWYYISRYQPGVDYSERNHRYWSIAINERLGNSIDPEDLINKLKELKSITNITIRPNSKVIILQYNDNFKNDKERYQSLLNFYNYFESKNYSDSNFIELEPRKLEIINRDFDYVYHITTKQAYNKIKKVGLCPKSHNKKSNHGKRIYFLSGNILKKDLELYADNLYPDNEEVIILKIDIKKLEKERGNINIYSDPQTINRYKGMFTYNAIPSYYIERI